jgi:hypothetical protein
MRSPSFREKAKTITRLLYLVINDRAVVKYEVERLREEAIAPYVMTLSALA